MDRRTLLLGMAGGVSLLASEAGSAPARAYRVVALETPDGHLSWASRLNDRGEVVGFFYTSDTTSRPLSRACWWKDARLFSLPVPPQAIRSWANDINERSEIVGDVEYADGTTRAALWRDGEFIDLGSLRGNSGGNAINDRGEIVGADWAADPQDDGDTHAVRWRNGHIQDLHLLAGPRYLASYAMDINNRGQVVGGVGFSRPEAYTGDDSYAFLFERGRFRRFGRPYEDETDEITALAINNRGQMVGQHYLSPSGSYPWRLPGRQLRPLLPTYTGSREAAASDINDRGEIVGFTRHDSTQEQRSYLWRGGRTYRLNEMIPADAPWKLGRAHAINNRGEIAGTGGNGDEGFLALLLKPV